MKIPPFGGIFRKRLQLREFNLYADKELALTFTRLEYHPKPEKVKIFINFP